jgi:hypothetical protein
VSHYDPTEEQRPIIESDISALVIAGPGRGKTATAIAAAKTWLEKTSPPSQVLFTSFSNAAVLRIASSAGIELAQHKSRLQFRTLHSIAMELLRFYGRFVGIRKPARPFDNIEENLLIVERGWDTQNKNKYHTQLLSVARNEGLIAFQVMIPLATKLLKTSKTLREAIKARFPFIIIDEFQDTTSEQWEFIKELGEQSRVLALGDPDQMIYEHAYLTSVQRLNEFEGWKNVKRIKFDGPNFRCDCPQIIAFAEGLLHGNAVDVEGSEDVTLFSAYRNARRAGLALIWSTIIKQFGASTSVAFIVPSMRVARELAANLRNPGENSRIQIPVYAKIELNEGSIDSFRLAVFAAADFIGNRTYENLMKISVALCAFRAEWSKSAMTTEKVEQLFKNLDPKSRAKNEIKNFLWGEVPKDVFSFAKAFLLSLSRDSGFKTAAKSFQMHGIPKFSNQPLNQIPLFDEYRQTRGAPRLQGHIIISTQTTMVSMYRSKGREFDFVVLMVDDQQHSMQTTLEEKRRLYYVAATRARKWLGVLYVKNQPGPVLGPVIGR